MPVKKISVAKSAFLPDPPSSLSRGTGCPRQRRALRGFTRRTLTYLEGHLGHHSQCALRIAAWLLLITFMLERRSGLCSNQNMTKSSKKGLRLPARKKDVLNSFVTLRDTLRKLPLTIGASPIGSFFRCPTKSLSHSPERIIRDSVPVSRAQKP
ncbi:hypothetical protein MPH_13810 [Macrophomina phaseolina MS6]|uniref:Uncharacterized protein n=1 Tax=Macrophomina phaseolina (strain MS6) TaxID=1126212 RepID=K2R8F2_MACPH|nr:hypothetical protein MPH_13810 [Macrophomina phaseolina MS6]